MFSKTLVAAALVAGTAFVDASINTPAALVQCQPVQLSWDATQGPYILDVIPGGQPGAAPLEEITSGTQATSITWKVDVPANTDLSFKLTDASGQIFYSSPVTVQAGADSSCLGASASPSAVAGASSTPLGGSSVSSTAQGSDATSSAGSSDSSSASSASSVASSASSSASSAASSASASHATDSASHAASSPSNAAATAKATSSGSATGSAAHSSASTPTSSAASTSSSGAGFISAPIQVPALLLAFAGALAALF